MFNLLPESLKQDIAKEYKLRRLAVILFFTLSIQISFLIFLFPSWVVSEYKERALNIRVSQIDEIKNLSNSTSTKPIIKSVNNELSIIDKSLDYPKILPYLNLILSKKNTPVKIQQFSYVSTDGSNARVVVRGVSATRESLVGFKSEIDNSKLFHSTDLPISNYAKDKNIDFDLTLTIANKNE